MDVFLMVGGILMCMIVLVVLYSKRRLGQLLAMRALPPVMTAAGANFFGQTSSGLAQVRGNGILILDHEQLFFEMLLPRRALYIRLEDIIEVDVVHKHMGKSAGRPLMRITFMLNGQADSCAWYVKHMYDWIGAIKKQMKTC